ncbi:hypothetical protein ACKXGF_03005 [Alkalibacillus sp. S2W]|uniref:hypothetical protein n=1 Tax=Alkalibacillus sp. S2W TaxID=3386553 RepID=UPI00398CFF39|nr:hypothetical protein [Alkalibacillus almallahensis]
MLIILMIISALLGGTFLVTLGMWELKKGINKERYIVYMTIGLFLILVILRI